MVIDVDENRQFHISMMNQAAEAYFTISTRKYKQLMGNFEAKKAEYFSELELFQVNRSIFHFRRCIAVKKLFSASLNITCPTGVQNGHVIPWCPS